MKSWKGLFSRSTAAWSTPVHILLLCFSGPEAIFLITWLYWLPIQKEGSYGYTKRHFGEQLLKTCMEPKLDVLLSSELWPQQVHKLPSMFLVSGVNQSVQTNYKINIYLFENLIIEEICISVYFSVCPGKPAVVRIKLEKDMVVEGGSITAECAANSNPQPHSFSWIRRHGGIYRKINSTQRTMSFHNITRNTYLSCMAHNDIGVGQSGWMKLLVQCMKIYIFYVIINKNNQRYFTVIT